MQLLFDNNLKIQILNDFDVGSWWRFSGFIDGWYNKWFYTYEKGKLKSSGVAYVLTPRELPTPYCEIKSFSRSIPTVLYSFVIPDSLLRVQSKFTF